MPLDDKRASRALDFFDQFLHLPEGGPFVLPDWQREIVSDIFGSVGRDGLRQYRRAYLEIPKKNGKTTFGGAIGLAFLVLDTHEANRRVILAATARDQAGECFEAAELMVEHSPALKRRLRVIRSTKTILLKEDPSCYLKAISADANTNDGIKPYVVIYDELHRQKTRDLWSVLKYGMSTRREPMMFAITTAGIESYSPLCWEQHEYAKSIINGVLADPSFYAKIYAMDPEGDWTDKQEWFKANPSLKEFKQLKAMEEDFRDAQRMPGLENNFRRYHLNQWVSQETRWIPLDQWDKGKEPFSFEMLQGKPCYAGLDLSTTQDISALVLLFEVEDEWYAVPHFWLPGDGITEKSVKDGVTYDRWASQNLIHLTEGNIIDYRAIRKTINDLGDLYDIREIAHDPWNATQIALELQGDGFTMVPVRQSFASLSPPSKELERIVLGQKLRHGGNPVLRWMADCVSVTQDPAGNIRPVKPDRAKSSKRIDGIVALIMALDRASRHNAQDDSVYLERGIITL